MTDFGAAFLLALVGSYPLGWNRSPRVHAHPCDQCSFACPLGMLTGSAGDAQFERGEPKWDGPQTALLLPRKSEFLHGQVGAFTGYRRSV
ncbi:MAG: hypothetical protein QOK38_4141 [Acidobacteriaceae bacterium]|jgi:hypothetical protein|nr:hypothetical protein [Acidobacteriaceae bacterium]